MSHVVDVQDARRGNHGGGQALRRIPQRRIAMPQDDAITSGVEEDGRRSAGRRTDLQIPEVNRPGGEFASDPQAVLVVADGAQIGGSQAQARARGQRRGDLASARSRLLLHPDLGERTSGFREYRQPADLVDATRPDAHDVERHPSSIP
jgi:hypothetical protein